MNIVGAVAGFVSAVLAIIAASLWFQSARVVIPTGPGKLFWSGAAPPPGQREALDKQARLSARAAIFAGASALAGAVAAVLQALSHP